MKAIVVRNNLLTDEYNILELSPENQPKRATPGQFVMLEIPGREDKLLRRPFAVFKDGNGKISLLIKMVGTGTKIFRNLKEGNLVDLNGPYGRGYDLKELLRLRDKKNNRFLFFTGVCGIASVYLLLQHLKDNNVESDLVVAARTNMGDELRKIIKKSGVRLTEVTEDGSSGIKGIASAAFSKFNGENYHVICCGPRLMMKAVNDFCAERKYPALFSLEVLMACGFGACYGCAIKTSDGMKRVCKEGPVFDRTELEPYWKDIGNNG